MKENKFKIEDSEIQNPKSRVQNPRSGFTLIEIAMVLVVIGILLSIGVGMLGTLSKRAKYNEARDIVKSAREAVYGYAVKNGFLPAADISLAGARALDPWGRALEYRAAAALSGSGNACGLPTTDITVLECTNADCTTFNTKPNIAFVVYSKGEDADGACTGTASPFRIWEQYTGYNSPCTYAATNAAHQYDDIVQYVTLDEIRYLRSCPQALVISGMAFTTGVEDTFYSYSMQAAGGLPPYTWSGTIGSGGLSLGSSGLISGVINVNALTNTGELTVCPATIITVPNTITATDSATPTPSTVTFGGGSIAVNPQPLNITTPSLRDGQTTVAYSAQLQGTGGKNNSYAWSVTAGALPAGITINTGGVPGLLSGTPTTAGTYNFTVTLSDTCTATAKAFTLNIAAPIATSAPTCNLSANPTSITSGQASTLTWAINNGPANGAFSPTSGTCSSFTSSNSGSCTTAALAATTSFVLTVTNANGTANCAATVTVTAASCTAFTGWSSTLPNATNCSAYTGSTTVLGGVSPYTWSLSAGALPSGISFCTGNTAAACTVSGTPLASPGAYSFTPQATDSCASPGPQTTSQGFSITVSADACYTSGITVRNRARPGGNPTTLYYKRNGGVCTAWDDGNTFTVLPVDAYLVYSNSACTTAYCASAITYCTEKPRDANADCKTQIGNELPVCNLIDR